MKRERSLREKLLKQNDMSSICAKTEDRKCIVHGQEIEIGVSEGDGSEEKENSQLRMLKVVYKIQTWGLLLRFYLPMQGLQVQYLVWELISHMPPGQKNL